MWDNCDDTGQCIEAFVHHYRFKSWEQWTTEYLNRWEKTVRRCDYFLDITRHLISDYNHNGYKFIYGINDLCGKIMVWAYTIDKEYSQHYGTRLTMPPAKHRNSQKDKDEYNLKFNEADMNKFYSKKFADENLFNSELAKDYFWYMLSYFLYRLIDIKESPHIQRYDAEEERAKEEEIERLLQEGVLTLDARGRIKKTDKLDLEDIDAFD